MADHDGHGPGGDDWTDEDDDPEVEADVSKRWSRTEKKIIDTRYKTVFQGFDNTEGLDVAWHQIRGGDLKLTDEQVQCLFSEVQHMEKIEHARIVNFHACWKHPGLEKDIVYVTELFTSGTLRQYRAKHRQKKMLKAVRSWLRQILKGISHLHGMDPPIVHRNIKPSSIFVHGNQGEVKIGDMGLPSLFMLQKLDMNYVRYFAPEMLEDPGGVNESGAEGVESWLGHYGGAVDIYAFGMTMLELVSLEEPYSECKSAQEVCRRATQGVMPDALGHVEEEDFREVIAMCLAPAAERPTAKQLLQYPFFKPIETVQSHHAELGNISRGDAMGMRAHSSHDLGHFGRVSSGSSETFARPPPVVTGGGGGHGHTRSQPTSTEASPRAGARQTPPKVQLERIESLGDPHVPQQGGLQMLLTSPTSQPGQLAAAAGVPSPKPAPPRPAADEPGGQQAPSTSGAAPVDEHGNPLSDAVSIPLSAPPVGASVSGSDDMGVSPSPGIYAARAAIQPSASCKSCLKVEGRLEQNKRMMKLKMSLVDEEGQHRSVQFPFDIFEDTAEIVASEMREELGLNSAEEVEVAGEIQREVELLKRLGGVMDPTLSCNGRLEHIT